jgi:hypothetical protein
MAVAQNGEAPEPDGTAAAPIADRPPSHLYNATVWDPVGRASGTLYVELQGYAKLPAPGCPFVVVNEFVASTLWKFEHVASSVRCVALVDQCINNRAVPLRRYLDSTATVVRIDEPEALDRLRSVFS